MSNWSNFFVGELGAAAALAGLLFVAVSVNQARILALGRMADRGLEGLAMLFLVLIMASLPLIPGQPPRVLGGEVSAIALLTMALLLPVERGYLRALEPVYRPRARPMVWCNRISMIVIAGAGAEMLWRGDLLGLYALAVGILLTFVTVGANAWVLLIEINR